MQRPLVRKTDVGDGMSATYVQLLSSDFSRFFVPNQWEIVGLVWRGLQKVNVWRRAPTRRFWEGSGSFSPSKFSMCKLSPTARPATFLSPFYQLFLFLLFLKNAFHEHTYLVSKLTGFHFRHEHPQTSHVEPNREHFARILFSVQISHRIRIPTWTLWKCLLHSHYQYAGHNKICFSLYIYI